MVQTEGIVSLHEIEIFLLIQHRECKSALDLLRHVFQAGEVEGFFLFDQLHRDIAVCLNFGFRQSVGAAQKLVIV